MINLNKVSFSELYEFRLKRKENYVPWKVISKSGTKEFCNKIGAATVQVLKTFKTVNDINFDELPTSFVLKPLNGHSSYGVMILEKIAENSYFEKFTEKKLSLEEIIEEQKNIIEKHKLAKEGKYIIEEYIPDTFGSLIPHDFKFFMFQGEVAFIMEINRNKGSEHNRLYHFYEPDFSPIKKGKIISLAPYIKKPIEKPAFSEILINLAKRVAVALPTPFVRVDLYFDGKIAKVGEITLTPNYGFPWKCTLSQDMVMGRMWIEAIEKLGREVNDCFLFDEEK